MSKFSRFDTVRSREFGTEGSVREILDDGFVRVLWNGGVQGVVHEDTLCPVTPAEYDAMCAAEDAAIARAAR